MIWQISIVGDYAEIKQFGINYNEKCHHIIAYPADLLQYPAAPELTVNTCQHFQAITLQITVKIPCLQEAIFVWRYMKCVLVKKAMGQYVGLHRMVFYPQILLKQNTRPTIDWILTLSLPWIKNVVLSGLNL